MGLDERIMYQERGAPVANRIRLEGAITIGAAGVVTTQSGTILTGVTFAKAAGAGQYNATIHKAYRRILGCGVFVTMPAIATAPTLAAGNQGYWQGITAAMWAPGTQVSFPTAIPTTGLSIQLTRTDTQAAADATSGVTVTWFLDLADS